MMQCCQCDKEINILLDIYVDLDQKLYHHKCLECKSCNEKFDFVDKMPIIDQTGRLYCSDDFIQTLECALCSKHFDSKSKVFNLRLQEQTLLAHVECTKCWMCGVNLEASSEYVIDKCGKELRCRKCFVPSEPMNRAKCIKSINHRLSSRQKELLATKIILDKIDVEKEILCETSFDLLLDTLSDFVKCSKKSLSNYIVKHLNKVKSKRQSTPKSIETLLNDLKSLDKIVAPPNQCPFKVKIKSDKNIPIDLN